MSVARHASRGQVAVIGSGNSLALISLGMQLGENVTIFDEVAVIRVQLDDRFADFESNFKQDTRLDRAQVEDADGHALLIRDHADGNKAICHE